MHLPELSARLPDWVAGYLADMGTRFPSLEARMDLVIGLARENVERRTGGPFAAAVFDRAGELVMPAVNLVLTGNCSILHAEILAIALAERRIGCHDLGQGGGRRHDLVSSAEPCAMCFGAILWSGIDRLICGARSEDAEAIGFDEGPKPADWVGALNARGIEVVRDVLRDEAAAVLRRYAELDGPIYNSVRPAAG